MTLPRISPLLGLPALTGVYFVAGKLGLMAAFVHASASPVWPPTGIALAAMLLRGYGVWPAVFFGAFLVNLTTAGSVLTSIGIAMGNTLEGLVGAWLVTRFANGRRAFDRPRDVFTFVGLAALLSTTVSATMGVTSLSLGGYADWGDYDAIWLTWWLGDAAGDLVVAPLIMCWATPRRMRWTRRRVCEVALLVECVLLLAQAVFNGLLGPAMHNYPVAFLCIPPLLWAAFRFGQREAVTVIALLSGIAIMGTLRGLGPFARPSPNESLLLLQAYMATAAMTAMTLAAVVAARRRAEEALARVAAIVESSDDAITSGTLDGVITSWNGGAARLYGYSAREVVGQSASIIIPPERQNELPAILDQLRHGGRLDHYETVRVRSDGARIDVSVTVSPVKDPEGRIVEVSSITRDITERNATEVVRRERDILRSVASLAAAAAHEINNPLTVLMGYVQLLPGEVSPAGGRRLDEMLAAILRIRDIVARMNRIERVELAHPSGRLPEMLDLQRSSTEASEDDTPGSVQVCLQRSSTVVIEQRWPEIMECVQHCLLRSSAEIGADGTPRCVRHCSS